MIPPTDPQTSLSQEADDTRRINALESLIEQAEIKGVEIGRGCYFVITVGGVEIACENSLRDALDAVIDLQTESVSETT